MCDQSLKPRTACGKALHETLPIPEFERGHYMSRIETRGTSGLFVELSSGSVELSRAVRRALERLVELSSGRLSPPIEGLDGGFE